jgi:hypothetical protein
MSTLHAVIGVRAIGRETWYVKRSPTMANYPGVWSLLSIQHGEDELPDVTDLAAAMTLFRRMSQERLGGVPLVVTGHLTSGTCTDNPMQVRVVLHLYAVSFQAEPVLDPAFYTEGAWMLPSAYVAAAEGQTCGLCMRLWSAHSVRVGLAAMRFAPEMVPDDGVD